jgi:hypothetical protein
MKLQIMKEVRLIVREEFAKLHAASGIGTP